MKPPVLISSNLMDRVEARVHSSASVLKLENRILVQASSVRSVTPDLSSPTSSISSSCPALQPSFLSSTQLKQDLFPFPSVSSSNHSPFTASPAGGGSAGGGSAGGGSARGGSAGGGSAGGGSAGGGSAGGGSARGGSAGGGSAGGGSAGGGSARGGSAGGGSARGGSAGGGSAGGGSAGGGSAGGGSADGGSARGGSAGAHSAVDGSVAGIFTGSSEEKELKFKSEQVHRCYTENVCSHTEELTEDVDPEDPADPQSLSEREMRVSEEEKEWTWTIELAEEFGELETDSSNEEAELLKEKKFKLLNLVCCSLVNKSCSPGQKGWEEKRSVWRKIRILAEEITHSDPEFLLKVAVYSRQELNKHLMASYLIALAAYLPASKPHVRRYFCAAVRLPSDWLQVPRIYSTCFSSSLPTCLKKGLVDKFKQFSESQLAKYCTRRRRKHKAANNSPELYKKWAELLRSNPSTLQRQLQRCAPVNEKQSEFTMQNMIKRLHIKEPAELVMSILGKKYPADVKAFKNSGLSGDWLSDCAGQRMKLEQPDSWQTTLSREGNTAKTWEKLIDSKSLPFVVMLKNLRNIISQGISADHHHKILKRLRSESAVIQSKLLPLRFLSAYKAITELKKSADGTGKVDSSKAVLLGILNRFKRSKCFRYMDWSSERRRRLRVMMGVPFIYRLHSANRRFLLRARQRKFSQELLEDYLQALLKAVQISCTYNIPLIPGHTLICISHFSSGVSWYEHFCPPAEPSEDQQETSSAAGSQLTAVPLAVMLGYGCERSQVLLTNSIECQEADHWSGSLLDRVRDTVKQMEGDWTDTEGKRYSDVFSKLSEDNAKLDNIILMTEDWQESETELETELEKYRKKSSSEALVVNVMDKQEKDVSGDPHTVDVFGLSNQMLRFVSERGSSRLLDHVELIHTLYDVPPPAELRNKPERAADLVPLPTTPTLRWREVRVYISSAWRDMGTERNVLVQSVFPELRRRAAPHCLYLQEVELRSGVTEEDLARAVELCLSEVGRSQLMLGILGERYGPVLPRPALDNLPEGSWLGTDPCSLSITEMEIRQFQSVYPDSAQNRMFFYFRSPQLLSSVPVAWRADFTAESRESEDKLKDLKEWIRKNEFRVIENYPCEWSGVVGGRPAVGGLEEMAKAVTEDLWTALQKLFVEEVDEADLIKQQEMHQEAQRRHFHRRRKFISAAMGKIQESQRKGGILLVEGSPGAGKTAFMAAVAHALKSPACDVISYSTAASQSARSISHMLRCLVQSLRKMKEVEEELAPSVSYRALRSEFHLRLADLGEDPLLVLLVDGADLVHDARGQMVSDWIPENIPKGVCLVLSVSTGSALCNSLSKRRCCVSFPLGLLPRPERWDVLLKELGVCGGELRDSESSKQMMDSVQALPQSLCELVQHTLLRLQAQFGIAGLDWTLAALSVSSTGLRDRDLYTLLNLCSDLSSIRRPPTWQETLHLAKNPKNRVPMMVLCQLAVTLRRMIQPSFSHSPDEPLAMTNEEVRSAFMQFCGSTEEDLNRAHLIISAHLWVRSDPHENNTFIHCDAEALNYLLTHLMKCGQWEQVHFLLSSYYFLYANVRHGLLHPLLESYTLLLKRDKVDRCLTETSDDVWQCEDFLKHHAPLLSHWPALFVQQALNEADDSPARVWAERIVLQGGVRALKRLNKTGPSEQQDGELVSRLPWAPSCVAVSPGGVFLVVGTEKGILHIFLLDTKQEVRSLVSTCDGISGCIFLEESVVCITSYSGQVEVWDFQSGCRTARLNVHSRKITGCDVSSDRKLFATVSLDFSLKVWSSRGLQQVAFLLQPSPPNCVTFDPAGILVAVGCWDGAVRVWKWIDKQEHKTLIGHGSSVRCVRFCSSSYLLCSGSLDGEVRLWSLPAENCMWRRQAHCGSVEALSFLADEEIMLSAGRDGTVHLWSAGFGRSASVPREQKVDTGFLRCPGGAVRALACGRSGCVFSVSADRSVRAWSLSTGTVHPPEQRESLSAVCFLEKGKLLVCGFSSGRLELWHQNKLIYSDKVSDGGIGAVTGMPDKQLAVSCSDRSVTVWKLELDSELCTAGVFKVSSYTLDIPAAHLLYSNVLLAVCREASIVDVFSTAGDNRQCLNTWFNNIQPLGVVKKDAKSFWIVGESKSELQLIFVLSVVSGSCWYSDFCNINLGWEKEGSREEHHEEKREEQSEEHHEEKREEQSEEHHEGKREEQSEEHHEEKRGEQSEEHHEEKREEQSEEHHEEKRGEQSKEHHEEKREEQSEEHLEEKREEQSKEHHEGKRDEQSEEHHEEKREEQSEGHHEEKCEEQSEEYKQRKVWVTAATIHEGFIVCGDAKGYMWTNQPPSMTSWTKKRRAHSDRVSVLRLTDKAIISASSDGTIKLWDRNTNKQVGLFVCGAPVEILEINEDDPSQLVCGDALGQVYFLSWLG
ncbi:telomerase protein component 1-like isoform X1 [Astyanax mexicanus]|uniref:telomerase protein component 1-like isoform X1 n=1 Tax=Astyanax mexicanus TaxID=7994 RepID=UPI0020CB5324|nr:telomerase protein component 1-like isoform X1 [Astyanax mexicanus]